MMLALRKLNKGLGMTDNRENDEFGFDVDDVESLKKTVVDESDSALELDIELQKNDSSGVTNDFLDSLGKAAKEPINFSEKEISNEKKSKNGLVLGLSGLAVACAVAVGGYFFVAPMVLGGGQQEVNSFGLAPAENENIVSDLSFSQLEQDNGNADANDAYGQQNSFAGLDNTVDGNELVAFSERDDSLAESEIGQIDDELDTYSEMPDEGDVVISPRKISDEERMYDKILAEASVLDAPHEAIKIDRNVVTMELQVKRMNRIEMEVADTRESLKDVRDVIGAIREQTSAISKALEDSNVNNKRLGDDIKQLSVKVESQIESQKADIAALKADLKNIEAGKVSSVAQVAVAQVAVNEQTVTKTESAQEPAVKGKVDSTVAQKTVNLPAPTARPVTVKAPAVRAPVARAECATTKVSENWRVKGVTPSSAYVERVQDGQGLLLKAGVSLPGFGTVKSFNPVERSVCTTSGIVRR